MKQLQIVLIPESIPESHSHALILLLIFNNALSKLDHHRISIYSWPFLVVVHSYHQFENNEG